MAAGNSCRQRHGRFAADPDFYPKRKVVIRA